MSIGNRCMVLPNKFHLIIHKLVIDLKSDLKLIFKSSFNEWLLLKS